MATFNSTAIAAPAFTATSLAPVYASVATFPGGVMATFIYGTAGNNGAFTSPTLVEDAPLPFGGSGAFDVDPASPLYLMRAHVLTTGATTYWVSREPSAVGAPTGPTTVTDVVIFKRLET